MKLSYRDKVIFICAIVAIILVAGFFLFIKPKYDEMTIAKSYLTDKEAEKAEIESKINTLPDIVNQMKEVAKSIEEDQERFVDFQDPYLNERVLREYLEGIDVDVMSINTSFVTDFDVEKYFIKRENINPYDLLIQGDLYNELPQEVIDEYNDLMQSPDEVINLGVTTIEINLRDSNLDIENTVKVLDAISAEDQTVNVATFIKAYPENFAADPEDMADVVAVETTFTIEMYHLFPLNIEKVLEEKDQVEIVAAETPAE